MTIKDERNNTINLTNNNFLASGGEADVYLIGNTVYKIFQNGRESSFIQKLNTLKGLDKNTIIHPNSILFDMGGNFVGYSMQYVNDGESLSKLFTKSYKSRNNITTDTLLSLIENMRNTTEFIHNKNCLIVDGNENNYVFNKKAVSHPYFIDVDSYQTKDHKATAFSPIITDPLALKNGMSFSKESDWYSYAIVTFQLLTNIHPFKGNHPKYTKKDVLLRMADNVSVFNKEVQMPSSVEDFSIIPKGLLGWYEDLFVKGIRTAPPSNMFQNAPVKAKETHVKGSDKLNISESSYSARTMDSSFYRLVKDKVEIFGNLNGKSYVKKSMNVPPNAKAFGNVVYYPIFKKNHFIVLSEEELVHTTLGDEFEGYSILDATYKDDVLVLSITKDNKYFVAILKQKTGFSRDFGKAYIKEIDSPTECNFTVLSNGVIIVLDSDEDLIITHKKRDEYKVLKDVRLPVDGKLTTNNYKDKVLFEYKDKIYQVEMK